MKKTTKLIAVLLILNSSIYQSKAQNTMKKLNLTKEYPAYYQVGLDPVTITLDAINYLTISGQSAPEDQKFIGAIEAIYPIAYGIKGYYKAQEKDFVVPKMECIWWVADGNDFEKTPKGEWFWKIIIRMPEFVDIKTFNETKEAALAKKKLERLNDVNFEEINEGKCIQVLHLGSYDEEAASIGKIFNLMAKNNLQINGYHHEIYISDPTKTAVENLKTIIRYPVK